MVLLENDSVTIPHFSPQELHLLEKFFQFLSELTKLFQKARQSGAVTMIFKRCKYGVRFLKSRFTYFS